MGLGKPRSGASRFEEILDSNREDGYAESGDGSWLELAWDTSGLT